MSRVVRQDNMAVLCTARQPTETSLAVVLLLCLCGARCLRLTFVARWMMLYCC